MTYGYRLNVEDIFFRLADECFETARGSMEDVPSSALEQKATTVRAPRKEEAISASVLAVVGWAIGFESFVNLTWRLRMEKVVQKPLLELALKKLSTLEKAAELHRQEHRGGKPPAWLNQVQLLFGCRNRFVHFKEGKQYIGHEFEPEIVFDLSEARLLTMRDGVRIAIAELAPGQPYMRTSFLRGRYRILEDDSLEDDEDYEDDELTRYHPADDGGGTTQERRALPSIGEVSGDEMFDVEVSEELRGLVLRVSSERLFRVGSAKFRREAGACIAAIGRSLTKTCHGHMFLVEAHVDAGGRRSANLRVTEERAQCLRRALIRAGIQSKRVESRGLGSDMPLMGNDRAEGRAANRRIEVIVLRNG